MIHLEINGRQVRAQADETLLKVIRREGIDVPTLCNIDGLPPTGACRMCAVEVEGARGLVPSCAMPVAADMPPIKTSSVRKL